MTDAPRHDNLEEFLDPANYDLEQAARSARRIAWHAALAREVGGPVLELGCGTGLVAIPMAEQGVEVVGVDLSAPMLAHARRKSAGRGLRVEWHAADVRGLDLGRRFRLVVLTGNTFQAFLTRAAQDALLATVARHLAPGGVFAFETRNPGGHDLTPVVDDEPEDIAPYIDVQGRRVALSYSQRYDAATQVMHWTSHRRWQEAVRPVQRDTRIDCRFTGRAELATLLADGGFELVAQHGDWDGSAVDDDASPSLICRCRRTITAP